MSRLAEDDPRDTGHGRCKCGTHSAFRLASGAAARCSSRLRFSLPIARPRLAGICTTIIRLAALLCLTNKRLQHPASPIALGEARLRDSPLTSPDPSRRYFTRIPTLPHHIYPPPCPANTPSPSRSRSCASSSARPLSRAPLSGTFADDTIRWS